jgi:tRNA-dihydrouridine synthase A
MLDWTDRHDRYFLRLLSKHIYLYSEMVTTGALLFGKDSDRYLVYSQQEHPLALQLGGSDPEAMARCGVRAQDFGYDEVNINCGCPSDRVQNGSFGACLMKEPQVVADCYRAMQTELDIPVSIKHRIGVDDHDSFDDLIRFIDIVAAQGCGVFILHARKAWLKGLSPKENREIPPLNYDFVYKVKQKFPELEISLNGGVKTLEAAADHLNYVDGVMIGREAYENPWLLSEVDSRFYGEPAGTKTRHGVLREYVPYVDSQLKAGVPLHLMTRHLFGLFAGLPGARAWRRHLTEKACLKTSGPEIILEAAAFVPESG